MAHVPGAWRIINADGGWKIARLDVPGYVAAQAQNVSACEIGMHDLYSDAVKAADPVVQAAPDLLKAATEARDGLRELQRGVALAGLCAATRALIEHQAMKLDAAIAKARRRERLEKGATKA